MAEDQDSGVKAITALLAVLGPLKQETRANVLEYVFKTLGITPPSAAPAAAAPVFNPAAAAAALHALPPAGAPSDLRSLTEQKQPKTANQMVALMGYYLANLAPQGERRDYIVADDIKKYFVQANYELPTAPPRMTLVNAKNAGYLDALSDGQYRLNPVGHNLVTHKLPRSEGSTSQPRRKKTGKKTAKKTKTRK